MKLMYLLATFAVVLVMMASCTRQSVTGYTLTAAIDGIPDGSHVQLFPVSHGHEKPVADTTVVDGKFIEEFYKLKYCSTVVYMVPRA